MKKYLLYRLIVIIFAIVGTVTYKSYSSNRPNKPSEINESNKTNLTNTPTDSGASSELFSYAHPELGFSFNYPGNYQISNLADDQGETILLQDNGKGAQIYISDFVSKEEFNSAMVRRELGQDKLNNLKDIAMPGGFNAVSFSGQDKALGEVWDVWFVKNGKLYQITSQPGQEKLLKSLVESLKFE